MRKKTNMADFKVFIIISSDWLKDITKWNGITAEHWVWKLNPAVLIRGRELNMFAKAIIEKNNTVIR